MGGEGKQGVGTPRAWEPETPRPRGTPQEEDWGAVGLAPLSHSIMYIPHLPSVLLRVRKASLLGGLG